MLANVRPLIFPRYHQTGTYIINILFSFYFVELDATLVFLSSFFFLSHYKSNETRKQCQHWLSEDWTLSLHVCMINLTFWVEGESYEPMEKDVGSDCDLDQPNVGVGFEFRVYNSLVARKVVDCRPKRMVLKRWFTVVARKTLREKTIQRNED